MINDEKRQKKEAHKIAMLIALPWIIIHTILVKIRCHWAFSIF